MGGEFWQPSTILAYQGKEEKKKKKKKSVFRAARMPSVGLGKRLISSLLLFQNITSGGERGRPLAVFL